MSSTGWHQVLDRLDALEAQLGHLREVVQTVAGEERWLSTDEAADRLGMSRSALDELEQAVPDDLPGAPMQKGEGSRRRHLQWDATELATWRKEAEAWRREEADRRKAQRARRRKRRKKGRGRRSKRKASTGQGGQRSSSGRRRSLLAEVTDE